MIRVNKNLTLFFGLFVLLVAAILVVFQKFLPLFSNVVYYCQSFIASSMIQIPQYLNLVPFVLLFGFTATLGIKLLKFYFRSRSLKSKLNSKIIAESKKEKTVVIKSSDKFAFCLGIRNPKIYISTNLISKLSKRELRAVIEHELYHLERKDTLINLIVFIVGSLSFAFPVVKDFIKKYRIEREIEADKYAIDKIGDRDPLISTLRKLLAFPTVEVSAHAAIADQDTLEPRICSLVNKPYTKRQFGIRHLLITTFSFLILAGIVVIPVHAKDVYREDVNGAILCAKEGQCAASCERKETTNRTYSIFSHPYTPAR